LRRIHRRAGFWPSAAFEIEQDIPLFRRGSSPGTDRLTIAMRLALNQVNLRVDGEHYLRDIDLTLDPGSLNVLLGPTRAGKTSLMRVMAGLDPPTSGKILVDGVDVTGVGVRARNVSMVYQQFVNYPSLTVAQNIGSPLRQSGRFDKADIERKVRATAELLRIDHLLERYPAELSGGQQQRTAIARALIKEADLLLIDEPLVNLDYKLREELRAELRELFRRRGTTVVYGTTEPQEALILGGNVFVMDEGSVLQFGAAIEVYHQPNRRRVAEVFSDPPINLLPVRLDDGSCYVSGDAQFARPEHMRGVPVGDYRMGLRAEDVGIGALAAGAASLKASVQLAEISGSETFVHASHGDLTLIAQLEGVHQFILGEQVTLRFDPERAFLFDLDGKLVAAPRQTQGTR
jgi:glycerol transport system ATP-binding protein